MEWLNYHHLLYFWTAAREGSVTKAAAKLRLAQPTVSAQIRRLEEALGERVFQRQGRVLVPTPTGRLVLAYADDIFALGRELQESLRGRPAAGRAPQLTVGVADAVPKLVVSRLLRPVVSGPDAMRVVCREDEPERLVALLSTHAVDVVIADAPAPAHVRVKAFNHLLGESATSFFGPPEAAARLRRGFPRSLNGTRVFLPTANTSLRRDLDAWFEQEGLRPQVAGEFEDSALMKAMAESAGAVFPGPSAIAADIARVHDVKPIGRAAEVRERYYAISVERRVTHPGILAITATARGELFAG
jgi:LysR family transcriptional activator of nhaA